MKNNNKGKFEKGHKPWNAGKKLVGTRAGFQKGNKLGRKFVKGHNFWKNNNSVKNQFKKGEKHNHLELRILINNYTTERR